MNVVWDVVEGDNHFQVFHPGLTGQLQGMIHALENERLAAIVGPHIRAGNIQIGGWIAQDDFHLELILPKFLLQSSPAIGGIGNPGNPGKRSRGFPCLGHPTLGGLTRCCRKGSVGAGRREPLRGDALRIATL